MILLLALACAPAGDPPLRVLAAASVSEALTEAAAAFEGDTGRQVVVSLDATSRLAAQLQAGAPADVFVSADEAWMDLLSERGAVDPESRVDLLRNRLVVVVPAQSARGGELVEADDLLGLERIALAGDTVPAGRYARQALERLGVHDRIEDRIVSGDSVRSVLAWVARGEVPAGVVYATDARVEPRVRVAFTVPESSHAPIVYPAALTRSGDPDAAAFLAFLAGEGRASFEAAGFEVLAP